MNKKLRMIQKTFIVSIVALVTISLMTLSTILYATNAIEVNKDVTSSQLHDLTKGYPEVAAYLDSQKNAEPHFIRIANLIQADQQALLVRGLLLTGIPILILSGLLAYVLAGKLVKPVEEAFSAQERFLQDASHEMRNPLAALYAVIQEAKNQKDVDKLQASLSTLERQAQQLVKLNDDLLLLERSKTNHSKAKLQDISELLLDVIDSEYAHAKQHKITITHSVDKGINKLIDQADWVSITRNIINNAIKYSKPGSRVTISLKIHKQRITFKVKDKGIGIPADQLGQIGERFYRASNVGRKTGTGLGMAIVRQTVEAYQGNYLVTSKQGKGTTVIIHLPLR